MSQLISCMCVTEGLEKTGGRYVVARVSIYSALIWHTHTIIIAIEARRVCYFLVVDNCQITFLFCIKVVCVMASHYTCEAQECKDAASPFRPRAEVPHMPR